MLLIIIIVVSTLSYEIIHIILLTQCHEEVLYLQPMIPPNKSFGIFPPDWGMLRRSRRVQIFL